MRPFTTVLIAVRFAGRFYQEAAVLTFLGAIPNCFSKRSIEREVDVSALVVVARQG